jgi:hypothetical protein
MWSEKTKVITLIIQAPGTISQLLRKYLSSIPGKHDIKKLEKPAILGNARILEEVLIIIKNEKEETCMPIHEAVPAGRNDTQKRQKSR